MGTFPIPLEFLASLGKWKDLAPQACFVVAAGGWLLWDWTRLLRSLQAPVAFFPHDTAWPW